MGWFRSRSRWGSCLALFALAFQLAVSFAHVHLNGVSGRSPVLSADQASTGAVIAFDPAGKDSPTLPDHHCPACALIHLAGALVPAMAPSLPLPIVFDRLLLEAAVEFDLTGPQRTLFHARAPPIA